MLVVVAVALWAMAPGAAAAPRVHQMVVFKSGKARVSHPRMAQTTVTVRGRRCAVAANTALAGLVRSRVGPLSLRDYGACSSRPADGGGLFVAGIGPDRNRASDGWVYKAGNVLGTAGAADPSGPLGRGRLRAGTHVTWFWCHVTKRDGGCPHTLVVTPLSADAGQLRVRVRHYDDQGKGALQAGATVKAGDQVATTGADGVATLALAAGRHTVYALCAGRIRSFPVAVTVR